MRLRLGAIEARGTWPVAIAIFAALLVGVTYLFRWAWNELAADVFGAPHLTAWQAFAGIVLLSLARSTFTKNQNGAD